MIGAFVGGADFATHLYRKAWKPNPNIVQREASTTILEIFADSPAFHGGERVLEPVSGLSDASTEEDDEYIMPVNLVSEREPKETEWTRSTKESMLDDLPIVGESDDERPLINKPNHSINQEAGRRGRGSRPPTDDNFHRYA